jgi:hypothetical protein
MTRAYNTATTQQNSGGTLNPFAAGKNKIINGDCFHNQRNFSSQALTTETAVFIVDRIYGTNIISGSSTFSVQQFTLGSAPSAGYEAKQFVRVVSTGQSNSLSGTLFGQTIEDVRTFAGQTITVSFWAKAGSGTPNLSIEMVQSFGTGGSPSGVIEAAGGAQKFAISTSWTRYSKTITLPSVAGKTLGTNNNSYLALNIWASAGTDFNSRTSSLGIQSNTFDIWGLQVEAGSVATPFTTATGTIQGELAACQRYAFQINGSDGNLGAATIIGLGCNNTTTQFRCPIRFPVKMRKIPSLTSANGANYFAITGNGNDSRTYSTVALDFAAMDSANLEVTVSSVTTGQALVLYTNNSAAYLLFNAEF